MIRQLGVSVRLTIVSVIVLGLIYPLAMTGLAQLLFPWQANGALVTQGGRVVGSAIIGERWTQARYFHGRPSAAGKDGYDPTSTGGTNLAPSSKKLLDATRAAIVALRNENPDATLPVPMDLVTSSASGIDPEISPEAAYYQAPRVAKARGLALASVNGVIARTIEGRTFGILGEPRVNVLRLNLALDASSASAGR
ncbi:MAG: potassium-transporting ATPase subunit KdpC [bacterium]|nr:potassium-transporting ATPase subunit KdpC [bacterium]